jgi:replicative DNA helicase
MKKEGGQAPQIPSDVGAEKSILATVFFSPDVFDTVMSRVTVEDFFSNANREVFAAMHALHVEGKVISRHSVADGLQRAGLLESVGGLAYLSDLADYQSSPAALEYLLGTVKDKALQRRLVDLARGLMEEGLSARSSVEELLSDADARLSSLLQEKYQPTYYRMPDIVEDVYKEIQARLKSGDSVLGIKTGFVDLDDRMSGLHKSNLIILAARPSMGKTALALNIASNVALQGKKNVVIFSLEMSRHELALRMLACEARVDARRVHEGRLGGGEMTLFIEAFKRMLHASIIVDDTPALTILDLRARARRLKKEGLCDLILVDYLQMIRGSGRTDSREQEISEISRMLKAIAKELEVPVVALSQLNRTLEARKDKRPQLSDLRESGAIEQDADVIVFIYRDEYYVKNSTDKGKAELIIGKQRSGPIGTVKVQFTPAFTRFDNLAGESETISL